MKRIEANLYDYQKRAINFIKTKKKCALFLNMGFGKTVISLTAIQELKAAGLINKVLIIAPKAVALSTWPNELDKWEHLHNLTYSVSVGPAKQRRKALLAHVDIVITTRDNIKWAVDILDKYNETHVPMHFDCIIVDESTSFKSPSTQRFKAVKRFMKDMPLKYSVIMSGTPSPNSLMDLWSQFFILDKGERLGISFHAFRSRYFFCSDYLGYTYQLINNGQRIISGRIKDISMSINNKTAGFESPKRINLIRSVQLPDKEKAAYKKLEKEFFYELDIDNRINVASAVAVHQKLMQFSNGAIYDNPENKKNRKHHVIHDFKLDELESIHDENSNENMLIAYMFASDVIRLQDRFPDAIKLDTKEKINDFENGKIKMALAHPASIGHGLNFQYHCSMIVWFGVPWSLELYQQFNARVDRQGQAEVIRIIHIITKGAIDYRIVDGLRAKAKTQDELIAHIIKHYKGENYV